jgi:hypothetical protein
MQYVVGDTDNRTGETERAQCVKGIDLSWDSVTQPDSGFNGDKKDVEKLEVAGIRS